MIAMRAAPSPIAIVFAWLTVSMLLLAGTPAQQCAATPATGTRHAALVNQLAATCALLDYAHPDGSAPHAHLKGRLLAEAPGASRLGANPFRAAHCRVQSLATAVAPPRPTLVGTIELRI